MKIKSYHILFHLLCYLADKTNGAPLLVKYKLLLGTLIIGVASSSANTLSKIKPVNDSIPLNDQAEITCYKPTIRQSGSSKKITLKRRVQDESREPLYGVSVMIKGKQALGILSDIDGNFTLEATMEDILVFSLVGSKTQEIPVSEIIKIDRPIVMKNSDEIMCYVVVVAKERPLLNVKPTLEVKPTATKVIDKNNIVIGGELLVGTTCYGIIITPLSYYKDDIYTQTSKRITKMPYNRIQTPPVSPVGDLDEFQDWMNKNVKYNEQMLKDKIQGDVILGFTIDKQGKIIDKKVIGKLSPEADAEALRVLSSSKKWTPGEHYGKRIKTTMTMTVKFNIPE